MTRHGLKSAEGADEGPGAFIFYWPDYTATQHGRKGHLVSVDDKGLGTGYTLCGLYVGPHQLDGFEDACRRCDGVAEQMDKLAEASK